MAIDQIDNELCVGCGTCLNSCSMDVIRLNNFETTENEITPCRGGCPAGVNIRSYIRLLKEGKPGEAIKAIREFLPIPAVTGRVCFHPCESECARREVDESININSLERYVADYWLNEKAEHIPQVHSQKIAVIGSGPAGITAAYDMVKMGYPVTVFEALHKAGGMLRIGIPEYKLPRDILDAQINYIKDLGVEFRTGLTIGKDISIGQLKAEGYAAFLFVTGSQLSKKINLKADQYEDVLYGLDFLRDVNLGKKVKVGEKVVVVGGGNVAIDVALTALRLGAKQVQVACLESGSQIPAFKDELDTAVEEGIIINEGWGPLAVKGEAGKIQEIEFTRCTSVYDDRGNFSPVYIFKARKTLPADMVIMAIGQSPDPSCFPGGLQINKNNTLQVDPVTMETSMPGIFAAGDVVVGAGSVVESIASGRKAAISVNLYLQGKDVGAGRAEKREKIKKPPQQGVEKNPRKQAARLSPNKRVNSFTEIKQGFDSGQAAAEVKRCMACGSKAYVRYMEDCMTCYTCELDCPEKAIYVKPGFVTEPAMSWD